MPTARPPRPRPAAALLAQDDARRFLVAHHGLDRSALPRGAPGVRALLAKLRCIQLDPLDVLGTNADLVALARVDGLSRGDVYRHLLPGHAFEHFAKERCLLPASAFPYYRAQAVEAPWFRRSSRLERVGETVVAAVLGEVRERGPVTASDLTHHGQVEPLDWHGWKSTARATTMALDVLWARCQIVVAGRSSRGKLFDLPERALPEVANLPASDFARWALLERVEAAGLLSRRGGAHWSMLSEVRTSALPDQLVEEGLLEEVELPGSPRRYLAPRGFRDRPLRRLDARLRILGPLDPMLWDRDLVEQTFGFEYVWEVYKPAHQRRWGWYVVPLLHQGWLVGRIEAVVENDSLKVKNLWPDEHRALDRDALIEALERHAAACGATKVVLPRKG